MQETKVQVTMDGVALVENDEKVETLLGCQIEPNLKWHKQVDKLQVKLKTRLAALQKLRSLRQLDLRKRIAEGIFSSILYCCLPVFVCCSKGELDALQVMQNKAARIVANLGQRDNRVFIYRQVGWMTVRQLIFYHSALATYRIRQSKEPEYLNNIMNRNNRANKIIISNTNLSLAKNSYCFRAAAQWNSLPEDIRNSCKIGQFKSRLRLWIHQNVPQFQD